MNDDMNERIRRAARGSRRALPGQQQAAEPASTQAEFDRVTVLIEAGRTVAEAEAQAEAEFHAAPIPDGKAGAGTGNKLMTKVGMNEILRKAAGR
jgi:hypothetical protein